MLANNSRKQSLEITIPTKSLKEGRYRLQTIYKTGSDSSRKIIPFDLVWFDKPVSLWDLQLSINPLRYIIEEEEFKYLTKGNKETQQKKLTQFWKDKDPTPETTYNELQKEFYTRVDSTLMRFSNKRRLGWRTDLGKIYISMGPPDKIEDHSLDPAQPHLKWIYKTEGKRLTYIFRAVDGRKEYELVDAEESSL